MEPENGILVRELAFLYIDNIGRDLKDLSFNFSSDIECNYSINEKMFYIDEREENICKNFFAENVNAINLLIGKNGSGKTSILNLLGCSNPDRSELFNKRKYGWFAIYKTDEQGLFYIEGYNPKLIENNTIGYISELSDGNEHISDAYSLIFAYDFCKKISSNFEISQHRQQKDKSAVFYLQSSDIVRRWYKERDLSSKEWYTGMDREYIKTSNYVNVFNFLSSKEFTLLSDSLHSNNISFTVKLNYANITYDEMYLIRRHSVKGPFGKRRRRISDEKQNKVDFIDNFIIDRINDFLNYLDWKKNIDKIKLSLETELSNMNCQHFFRQFL